MPSVTGPYFPLAPIQPNLYTTGNAPIRGLQPGGRAYYVGASGKAAAAELARAGFYVFPTLLAALTEIGTEGRTNSGDCIYVLPGHTENITGADYYSATGSASGFSIVGIGTGTMRPAFYWTAATSQWKLDTANVEIANCRLYLATSPSSTTATTVAAAIEVSAAGCRIVNNYINFGVDADQIVTLGIVTTAAGDDFAFLGNFCEGAVAAEITAAGTFLRLVGADRAEIGGNYIYGALATDTDGLIETLTTASTLLDIHDNYINANGSGNTCAIDFGAAIACTGRLTRNLLVVDADATAGTVVFTVNAANDMNLLDNFLVNDKNERGLVIGTASA